MKKTARCVGSVLAGLAVLAAAALSASAAERPGFETYVVRSGDTLSKIAGRVFGDPKRWREILAANPQVTNANRIYPGDALSVPLPPPAPVAAEPGAGLAASAPVPVAPEPVASAPAAGDAGQGAAAEAAPEGAPASVAEPEPAPAPVARVSAGVYRSAGSIAEALPAIAIVSTQDDRILLGTGDVGIVNAPVHPGRRFTVVRAERRVFHPKTGAYLGWLVRVLGEAEVSCRGERTSTVVLQRMRDVAGVGDYLVQFDPDDVLKEDVLPPRAKPECVSADPADGVIVTFDESERLSAGEQDIAYIDRGTAAGVVPGKRFLVYREIAHEGRVTIGEIQVLRAGERTAAVLITTSIQEVEVGDLLRAR